jgi:hypothetical protein
MILISKDLINLYPYPSIIPSGMVCYKFKIKIQMLGTSLAHRELLKKKLSHNYWFLRVVEG